MDAYIDIVLLPDPEFPATTLMSALFGKFHRGLVRYGEGAIGVSFPDVRDEMRSLARPSFRANASEARRPGSPQRDGPGETTRNDARES